MDETDIKQRQRKKLSYRIKLTILGVVSFLVSSVIYINSYSLFFNKPVWGTASVGYLANSEYVESIALKDSLTTKMDQQKFVGDFGTPSELRLPRIGNRLFLIPALSDGEQFLWRVNNAQYVFRSEASKGDMGNIIVYAESDWRTIELDAALEIDDNIFIDTQNGWRYMFRVTEKNSYDGDISFVPPTTRQSSLIFVIEEAQSGRSMVYFAQFSNLQNISR